MKKLSPQAEQYLNSDDDNYSTLGAAIFQSRDPFGMSIEDILEDDEDEDE